MKPSLQFRLSQHLTLTPQLQQSIRLLQLSTVELNQEIDRLLMENPALEREDHEEHGEHPPGEAQGGTSTTSVPAEPAAPEADWSADIASSWKGTPDDDMQRLALEIADKHLELLASRDYTRLKTATGAGDDALRAAQRLIQALNPRPGASFAKLEARYVIPDVIVRKSRNVWRATLNPDAMPRLRINRLYAELSAGARGAAAGSMSSLSSQLQEARWLIKNVQQRFETILRVSQAIVDRQRHFFEHGEVAMRPLVLREIADTLSLHESTVSRVTTQKFMFTPRGIFELKYFFGSHVATETGGACSATAIRALLKQLVAAEDGRRPLSDSKISEILSQQGIVVARRTIAKYRESLQIPSVSMRKSL